MSIPPPFRLVSLSGIFMIALAFLGGCSPSGDTDARSDEGEKTRKTAALSSAYPLETELTNSEGKVIKVTIVGRTQKEVVFVPEGDEKEVSYPLAKLSKKDRRRIGAMPVGSGPKPESPYVASRRKAIEENKRRIREIETEISGPSFVNTTANVEARKKKIGLLRKENDLLEQQIKNDAGN